MKRALIVIGILAVIGVAGWWGYNSYYVPSQEAAQQAAAEQEEVDDLTNVIWASGKLLPTTWAELNPANPGTVTAIHVETGDWVDRGDLLIEVDTAVLQSEVERAQAGLAEAQAALDKLLAGATEADMAAAEAEVAAAEAAVSQAAGQMLEAQAAIDAAKAGVETARREYAEMASHPTPTELTAAEAEIAIAEANVRAAQAAYNLVKGNPNIGALPESQRLLEATAALEAAKARYAMVAEGATPQQLAVAAAAIDAAETQVAAAEARAPGVQAGLQAAMARRDSAQAALDKLLDGATQEEIAMAQAQVQAATAAVNSAQAQRDRGRLTAPFDGQVGAINIHAGEAAPGEEPAVILGDTTTLYVETTDLRETDVVNIYVDMPVELTFDALPDEIFSGRITQIAPVSTLEQGSTNYTVKIAMDESDDRLRWGMTAFVNIQTERR